MDLYIHGKYINDIDATIYSVKVQLLKPKIAPSVVRRRKGRDFMSWVESKVSVVAGLKQLKAICVGRG